MLKRQTIYFITIILLSLALTGCSSKPEQTTQEKGTTFAKTGIRFDCPVGWAITSDKQTLENEYLTICEKDGEYESGLFMAKWTTNPISEMDMLELLQKYYQETYGTIAGLTIDFDKIDKKKNKVEYAFSANDVKHRGWIEIKKCPGLTAGLFFQYAKADYSRYKNDFETIKNSFGCL
ncbi:hypothetical protein HZB94_01740 [Candidatus Falkowbacteria bacterium]|nr:hypothetical protein [Candidatus Falkowbacteria bacterium]